MSESEEERFKRLDAMRKPAKVTNYSSLYGVGAKKLARDLGIPIAEAETLLKAFWDMNWAIVRVSKQAYTKKLKDGSMWLKNPVSGFYYSLRYEKDIWSTMNQGTGVYCFDNMVALARKAGIKFCMQFHDEGANPVTKGKEVMNDEVLKGCVVKLNEKLNLNIPLGIDVQYGNNYAEIH